MCSRKKAFVLLAGALLVSVACLWSAVGATAAPTVTQEGVTGHPFTFDPLPDTLELISGSDDQDLRLAVTAIARIGPSSDVYDGTTPDPRSVETLTNGDLLFTDRNSHLVAEVTRAGNQVWKYSAADDPDLQHPFSAQRFSRGGQEFTLIADRWACRVWAVDDDKNVVWQYGVTNDAGVTLNHLADPFYAQYSSADGGTVLITDCNGGNRVIQVRYGDYRAGASDNGFIPSSILWSYGTPGVAGSGPGQLDKPHCAQRLDSGNVLITDADGARVFEVSHASKQIVWQYGATDQPGAGDGRLADPNYAARLQNGDTLIVDTGNSRVLEVAASGHVDKVYDLNREGRPPWLQDTDTGQPDPRAAMYTNDGLLAVAESQFTQIALLGYEDSAQATSSALDCGKPGVKKAFVHLTWDGYTGQSGTTIVVEYQLDGGRWSPCVFKNGLRTYDFRSGTVGKTISYRVTLRSTNRQHTPVLKSISIQSMKATTGDKPGGGGGDKPGGSGNSGGNGVYKYPATAVGGTGTYGTGSGSGGTGTGTGSGGSGAGTGRTGAGSSASSAADLLKPPVQSTGSGAPQAVQGYQTEGAQGVSGVPLRAAEGAQAPAPERPGPPVPVLALIGAGVVIAAAFFVPWPFAAAKIRAVVGFDHTRAKFYRPFWPLGK